MGFFQDLKQDLSQAVNDLEADDAVNGINLDDAADLDEVASSSEDLFGTADSDFADLEAMLEKEVEALGSEPMFEPEPIAEPDITAEEPVAAETAAAPETEAETEAAPEIMEEPVAAEPETMPEMAAEAGQAAEYAAETVQEQAAAETETPVEYENNNMKSEANNMEMEQLLNEVEQNVEEPALMDTPAAEEPAMDASAAASADTAIITEGMNITGDVSSSGNMDLMGSITGNIDILGKLNVTGSINGNSAAAEIYAESAQINGEIKSKGSVKIGQSSVVIGNIFATSAVIAGAVKGDIDVHGPVILDTSAIVMGNIKSKSVQINNGAVIEGMCSQCYAEISPTSFFNEFKKNRK